MSKVGDKVRFLNEVGGGRVVKIIDKRMVLVETDDGFEIPTLDSELVVVNTDNYNRIINDNSMDNTDVIVPVNHKQPHKKQQVQVEAEPSVFSNVDKSVVDEEGDDVSLHVAFVPKDLNRLSETDFDFYIINDSTYKVFYSISVWGNGSIKPIASSVIGGDTKELVKTFNAADFKQMLTLNIQAIYFKNIAFAAHRPEFFDVAINPIKMQKSGVFCENDYFEERALVLSISDSQREEMLLHSTQKAITESIKQKDKDNKPKPVALNEHNEIEEVDLHIHELVDNYQHMTAGEIIQIQLARFETALETGLRNNSTRRMIFIHGLGNGKLKFEITKILDSKYPKLRYQDASFKEYGYGATLVYLR